MWVIVFDCSPQASTLIATNPDTSREYISYLKLIHKHGQSVDFTLNVDALKVEALIAKISDYIYAENQEITIEEDGDGPARLSFSIPTVMNGLYFFDKVIAVLRNEIQDFEVISGKLPYLIQPTREAMINTNKRRRAELVTEIEKYADNNMRASVFITARSSELSLRSQYQFECPNYGHEIDDKHDEFDEHYVAEVYSQKENALIAELIGVLLQKQNKLIKDGYLKDNNKGPGPEVILSKDAVRLLSPNVVVDIKSKLDGQTAKFALDVIASIRALEFGGSHSHNRRMKQSKINGYGMRNIVALLWHCCKVATRGGPKTFMPGIIKHDAFVALVRGIANGARGNNRNDLSGDNLEQKDKCVCDKGRYNFLMCSFMGVFQEVKIVFDITDSLVETMQQHILLSIINHPSVTDQLIADRFLAFWLEHEKSSPPLVYIALADELKSKKRFNEVLEIFLDKFCNHNVELKNLLREQVHTEVERVEMMGFSYMAQVSPTKQQLQALWQAKTMPRLTVRMQQAHRLLGI